MAGICIEYSPTLLKNTTAVCATYKITSGLKYGEKSGSFFDAI
jgi:hypothetical protein